MSAPRSSRTSSPAVDLAARPVRAWGDSGDEYLAESLVIATGAQARWLGIPGEQALSGFGVSACATCDGFFFRGKSVAVIGGGNTAVEEALYLANLAKSVTLIHRRDSLRAESILQERLFAKPNVTVLWDTVVEEVLGTEGRFRAVRAGAARNTEDREAGEIRWMACSLPSATTRRPRCSVASSGWMGKDTS